MTEQERIQLLLDIQEHPEDYTDEQLDHLLQDEELAEFLEEMAMTKRALMRCKLSHTPRITLHSTLYKVAASIIGVIMLSGIAFAAIHLWGPTLSPPAPPKGGSEYLQATDSATRHYTPLSRGIGVGGEAIIFDNVPLDTIAMELATCYNKVVDIRSERAHDVRLYYKWHREDSLATVVSDLNHFEHVNMVVENEKLIVNP